jgi:MoaE-MoaD fusion protein
MRNVQVQLFASLRDLAGTGEATVILSDDAKVFDLKSCLSDEFPGLKSHFNTALVSVNREYAFDEDPIPEGAEIAIFPPVSGGMSKGPTLLIITEEELRLNDLLDQITLPTTGAVCFFTGMVRGITQGDQAHETRFLEYEAYQSMAESKMEQVADEIRSQWSDVEGIAIVQRIGLLEAGTPTVIIACSAAHRDSGVFEAARYGIDRLKEIVPIWKKVIGPGIESWVEGEYIPKRSDRSDLNL